MRLLVVRHAIAEDREAFARSHKDDAARPLTPDGRRKMARAAEGLKQLVPELELLAASPYKRALETAEIIAHAYGDQRVERDRKSTRLNSSHSQISYAVFCLKKKKFQHYRHEC